MCWCWVFNSCWWRVNYFKDWFYVNVYGSLYWGIVRGVGYGVVGGVDDEVHINIGDEFVEGVELEVGVKVVYINISKMDSMWILITV